MTPARLNTCLLVFLAACKAATPSYSAVQGTQVLFDAQADLSSQDHFYDFPWPSDLRLDATGHPDLRGFMNGSDNTLVTGLLATAADRTGFPVIAAADFRFNAAIPAQDPANLIKADKSSPLLLIDIDEKSTTRGALFPVAAATPAEDDYTPANLLAMAPAPGIVLEPKHQYAYVVRRSLKDAGGALLGIPQAFQALKNGAAANGNDKVFSLYQPLWTTLQKLGVPLDDVAAATVFTTGDVVADLADVTNKLREKYPVQIDPTTLHLDARGDNNARVCVLRGTITFPQFQQGTQPYDTDGSFVPGADGVPEKQGEMTVPITITLPKSDSPMPTAGYPLMLYVHGSGGSSLDIIDRGKTLTPDGNPTPGEGPAYVVAPFGLAAASSAMPLNPERLPGATDYAYLNPNNLPAFPSTFRQGVTEQRLFLEALRTLEIDPSALGGCQGVSLPTGATKFKFDPSHLVQMGQSMGAMYTNMVGAIEPRVQALVPTGAGGYWSYMILVTGLVPGQTLLTGLLEVPGPLQYLHPVLQLLETVWEPADPMVYMPRVARRPLPGHPVRPVYQVVGSHDAYFPETLLDAMALAYGNQQAGDQVWPTLQPTLALEGFDGMASYPVKQNRTSETGAAYTGVVVQYPYDMIISGHNVAYQLDAPKYQYGCFLHSFLTTGTAVVPAPAPLGTPCQE